MRYIKEVKSGTAKAARLSLLDFLGLSLLQQSSSFLDDAFSQLVEQSSMRKRIQIQLCLPHWSEWGGIFQRKHWWQKHFRVKITGPNQKVSPCSLTFGNDKLEAWKWAGHDSKGGGAVCNGWLNNRLHWWTNCTSGLFASLRLQKDA